MNLETFELLSDEKKNKKLFFSVVVNTQKTKKNKIKYHLRDVKIKCTTKIRGGGGERSGLVNVSVF